MNILIAIIPALIWGCTPLWVNTCGGKPIEQLLGTTYGALIVGIVLFLIKRPQITLIDFMWCFLAGIGWSVGQFTQYVSFKRLSVSTSVPITAGSQLIGVDLIGVLFFGSWPSLVAKLVGLFAIIIITLGVYLTTLSKQDAQQKNNDLKNIILLILGTGTGYTICSVFPRIAHTSGWATFPPQSVGMILSAIMFALIFKKYRSFKRFFSHHTIRNLATGFNSGLGTFSYLTSITLTGLSTAFTLSQMSAAISVIGSFIILHERKHGKALAYTIIGVALVILGGVMTSFLK